MAVEIIDRKPTKAGRVLITPEDGSAAYYATISRADEPSVEGTIINKSILDAMQLATNHTLCSIAQETLGANNTEDALIQLQDYKANTSTLVESVLAADQWQNSDAPFVQDIYVEGLQAEQNGIIAISQYASDEERKAAREAMLSVTGQNTDALIISADGELPEIDIPVCIICLG